MELVDRLKQILEKEYGITNEAELLEAVKNQKPLDIGIFVSPIRKEATA